VFCAGNKAENFQPEGWTAIWVFRSRQPTTPRVPAARLIMQQRAGRRCLQLQG
jgi:hypothetical protein